MGEISDFVAARLDEDDAVIRGVVPSGPDRDLWASGWPSHQLGITRARMRVELEAKRRLVALADLTGDENILRVLAMIYDEHSDWRPDWDVLDTAHAAFTQRQE